MIPHDRFPWKSHLTLAEVDERERLRAMRRENGRMFLDTSAYWRLRTLEVRSVKDRL
jgi:hypothetical protein